MKTETQDLISNKIEGILNDYATGIVSKSEAKYMIVKFTIDVGLDRLANLCKQVKAMRDEQRLYFETRNSKVLAESKRLEKDMDAKIELFLKYEKDRKNPQLPLQP
jgi:hypothetical protein